MDIKNLEGKSIQLCGVFHNGEQILEPSSKVREIIKINHGIPQVMNYYNELSPICILGDSKFTLTNTTLLQQRGDSIAIFKVI